MFWISGENACHVAGDSHFRTFDGALIQFQGICTYTLARPDSAQLGNLVDFNVEIKNENRHSFTKASGTQYVTIDVYGVNVKLDKDKKVYVSGLNLWGFP